MMKYSSSALSQNSASKSSVSRRKKIWQISQAYHCAIIGTCLGRKDLQTLAKKKVFQLENGMCDYDIHKYFSNEADNRTDKTRILHKYLDTKHKASIKRYSQCTNCEDIRALWEEDYPNGNIAGSFWAIISHPLSRTQLIKDVYGDCHMLSFDVFTKKQHENRKVESLQRQLFLNQKTIQGKQSQHDKIVEKNGKLAKQVEQLKAQNSVDQNHNRKLTLENSYLTTELANQQKQQKQCDIYNELQLERRRNQKLNQTLQTMSEETTLHQQLLALAESKVERLEQLISNLQDKNREQEKEISNMKALVFFDDQSEKSCDDCHDTQTICQTCEDLHTHKCQGPDLCGKTVLYVGGLHKMIPRYRELVEKHGGKFIHHDGGKENSKQLLPKLLGGADAVVCPIDCVSHDACKCVKKICKRYEKPFVMMRSSGLSSLAKELNNIC